MGKRFLAAAAVALCALGAFAQGITLPPSGGNQRQTVIQQIGPVKVSVDYSSPHVHSPTGEDRKGKIWGTLVPYGLTNLGFGTCKECPWRGGANENTVFTTSHDVVVQGQKLPAGSYALVYIAELGNELRSSPGFTYENWMAAAQYAIGQKRAPEALQWAEAAAHAPQGIGRETFGTLMTLATAQELAGKTADAASTREKAMNHPTATPTDIHQFGRLLLTQKKKDDAI